MESRYITLTNGKVVDTLELIPHTECYFTDVNDDGVPVLYCESIDGNIVLLGEIASNG